MQVFISHAIADTDLAAELTRSLRAAGIQAWNPRDSILPGDNWALEVGKALESSEVMVVVFTKDSHESPTIVQEVQYALTAGRYRGRVVPVLINFVTYQAGKDVPWILLRMDPVELQGPPFDFSAVVERVQKLAENGFHAST